MVAHRVEPAVVAVVPDLIHPVGAFAQRAGVLILEPKAQDTGEGWMRDGHTVSIAPAKMKVQRRFLGCSLSSHPLKGVGVPAQVIIR